MSLFISWYEGYDYEGSNANIQFSLDNSHPDK